MRGYLWETRNQSWSQVTSRSRKSVYEIASRLHLLFPELWSECSVACSGNSCSLIRFWPDDRLFLPFLMYEKKSVVRDGSASLIMPLLGAGLDVRRFGRAEIDLTLRVAAGSPVANLAEKTMLAIDTFPRKIAKQVHHAVLEVFLSRNAPAGSRSATWTIRIHAGAFNHLDITRLIAGLIVQKCSIEFSSIGFSMLH